MPRDPGPWRITDTALAGLSHHLLAHEPERGAALLGPRDQRLVTHVLPDPEPGTATGYGHSEALRELLADALARRRDLGYRGTVHTHPGSLAEPSNQDHAAFRAILEANPALRDHVLFPIAVTALVETLDDIAGRWGGDHLLPVDGGTVGGYRCDRSGGRLEIVPVRLDVLAVGSLVEALCAGTERTPRDAGVVRDATSGAVWLRYVLAAPPPTVDLRGGQDTTGDPQVLVSTCFPACPPMLSTGSVAFRPVQWDSATPEAERVARTRDALWS